MAAIGTLTVNYRDTQAKVIENVPEAQYWALKKELDQHLGRPTYDIMPTDGHEVTVKKSKVLSLEYQRVTDDGTGKCFPDPSKPEGYKPGRAFWRRLTGNSW